MILFVGLWKLEQSNKFKFSFESRALAQSEKKAKLIAIQKRRKYESNPNLDFDLLRITSGHSSPSSDVGNTFGQNNIISYHRK